MAYNHGHRRASNYGKGAVNFLLEKSNRVGEQVEKVARISYCSFRKFALVKRISVQLGGAKSPTPIPAHNSYAYNHKISSIPRCMILCDQ